MPQHEIQRMLPRHHRMVELALEGLGPKQIASALGCTPQSVSLVLKSPHVQDEIARRRERREVNIDDQDFSTIQEAKRVLEDAAVKAAQTQVSLLESTDDSIRLKSAGAILDRVYGKDDSGRVGAILINGDALVNLQIAISEADL